MSFRLSLIQTLLTKLTGEVMNTYTDVTQVNDNSAQIYTSK